MRDPLAEVQGNTEGSAGAAKSAGIRKIYTPQLMVMDVGSWSLFRACQNVMKQIAETDCRMSVLSTPLKTSNEFAATLIHHFPRSGGKAQYGNTVLEYIPRPLTPDIMRIRLYIAIPPDKEGWNDKKVFLRAGMIGLIVQSFIATELGNFHEKETDDFRKYMLSFDDKWEKTKAEIPMEERTMTSSSHVEMSCPYFTDMIPSIAVLKLDKMTAELDHERHIAKYIRRRLHLLGQLDSNRLLHLVFVLSANNPKENPEARKHQIETIYDVSVIKSPLFDYMPTCARGVHSTLSDTANPHFPYPTRYYWRIVRAEKDKYGMKPTVGGVAASLLGAVVHEVGHLFKIPHTDLGIMGCGSENIQTFFLPNKMFNLGFTRKELRLPPETEHEGTAFEPTVSYDDIIKQVMESSLDSTTRMLMSEHPLITHVPRRSMCPIQYDEDSGVVYVESGIRYVVYYTNDKASRLYSFTSQHLKKKMRLKIGRLAAHTARALIVSAEGNFLSVVVKGH